MANYTRTIFLCVCLFVLLCSCIPIDGKKTKPKPRKSRSVIDKDTSDYVKVFSAYLGEIPMTADIKRLEQNLPSDKKNKIYYLKKSQKYKAWSATRGKKEVRTCGKGQELQASGIYYIHGGEPVTAISPKIVVQKGFTLGQTKVMNKWIDQLTDGIEIKFGKYVHVRVIQFLGKHNIIKVAVEYKYKGKWAMMRNQYNKLDWMVVQRDSKVNTFVPKADAIRIYPQKFKGEKPVIYGVKMVGCI